MAAATCYYWLDSLLPSLLCVYCCSLWLLVPVAAEVRHVYWNVSNPIFKHSGDNTYLVRKNDRLVFNCPTNNLEFYRLYWTQSATASAACQASHSQVFSLLDCSSPGNSGVIQVTDFSPIPGAPTFDRTVYVFTPSTGDRNGLDQTEGGACATRNMRLAIDIGDPDSVTTATVLSTTATEQSRRKASISTAAITTSSGAGAGGDSGTASTSADSDGGRTRTKATSTTKQALSPTPQDLANHKPINLIIGASTALPSFCLLLVCSAVAALLLLHHLRLPLAM